jgi:hypothetical protein
MIHFSELKLRPGDPGNNGKHKIVSIGQRTKVSVTLATVSALRPDLVSLFCAAPRLYNELKNLLKNVVREDEASYASASEALALADFIPADIPAPRPVRWVVTELADGVIISTRIHDNAETALDVAVLCALENLPDAEEIGTDLIAKTLTECRSLSTSTGSYQVWLQEVEVLP